MTNTIAAELVPKKIVTLDDYAVLKRAEMTGFKFVHSADHDETLGRAVHIADSRFMNCDFSELRSCTFASNVLVDCIPAPIGDWGVMTSIRDILYTTTGAGSGPHFRAWGCESHA